MDINTSIKQAYLTCYWDDELGHKLNDVTFNDLFRELDNYGHVYDFIGVHDSVIRERLFNILSDLIDAPYEDIMDQWMLCKG